MHFNEFQFSYWFDYIIALRRKTLAAIFTILFKRKLLQEYLQPYQYSMASFACKYPRASHIQSWTLCFYYVEAFFCCVDFYYFLLNLLWIYFIHIQNNFHVLFSSFPLLLLLSALAEGWRGSGVEIVWNINKWSASYDRKSYLQVEDSSLMENPSKILISTNQDV